MKYINKIYIRKYNYKDDIRGVTIMPLYKVYMMALAEKIREEVEEKGIVPQNQTNFRKRMGTMDNI